MTKLNVRELDVPIEIDGREVRSIELRKPRVSHLKGIKLYRILELDVDEAVKLLPRISSPPLDAISLEALDAADLLDLCVRCQLFFVKRQQLDGKALTLEPEIEDAEEVPAD